jgi:acetyltransferase-like isoleucine patch superfamily enzyme
MASLHWIIFKYAYVFDGGEMYSGLFRKIFKKYYAVDIGMYTYGGCFIPYNIDRYTTIGRYCSFARTARVWNRNHPMEFKSTSPLFYDPIFEIATFDPVQYIPLTIGHDVWLGDSSIIMPNVTEIGTGAVVGAGAVVNKNVPPYALVVGNPARIVRYRFAKDVIDELLKSKWWEKSIEELKSHILEFQQFKRNADLLEQDG